jgi:quercetin dioxygenase-like cupin family protein/alkylhydroperoxidase/carboxymuconolactone decarboxylase family protein YurZ
MKNTETNTPARDAGAVLGHGVKSLLCLALSGAAGASDAQQRTEPAVEVRSAATAVTGSAENFTGIARITGPFQAPAPGRASGATVSFEPGARTAWHTHPLGQTLIVTEGLGVVQQEGQRAQAIRPGDVVTIPAHVRHWHGASATMGMTHVAVTEKDDGVSVVWLEQVGEQDHRRALASAGLTGPASGTPGTTPSPPEVSDVLSPRQRAIPLIAAFMAGSDMPRLNAALNRGLDAGMTISEAREILVQLYAYAGFPRSLNALGELLNVVEARKQRGLRDEAGREPTRTVATGRALAAAGEVNQTLISGGPVRGAVFDFAPVINQFLQAHLFGDIFERDNLDWQSRELATVGALAATPGAEAQLRSHMRASLRVGLSAGQLGQLTRLLEEAGPEAARRANDALTQALAAASKG